MPKLGLSNPFSKKIKYLNDEGKPRTLVRTRSYSFTGLSAIERSTQNLKKYWEYYEGEGTIFASINSTTWNTVMVGYTLISEVPEAKDLVQDLCDNVSMIRTLRDAVNHTLIFGDAFVEKIKNKKKDISRLKIVDPRTMIINCDKYGDTINFQQEIDGKLLESMLTSEDIIHFRFFPIPGSAYGVSLITPNIDTIDRKVSTDEALFNAIKRHGTKKWVAVVGNEKDGQIPPDSVMDDITKELEDIDEKNEFVIPWFIDLKTIDEKGIEGVEEYFNYFQTQLVIGLLCPEEALGLGKGSTEATARVKAIMYERMIKSFQNDLAIIIQEELFNPHLIKYGFKPNSVKMKFNSVTEEDEALRAKWLGNLLKGFTEGDIPFTKNEIRGFFGLPPREDMEGVPKGAPPEEEVEEPEEEEVSEEEIPEEEEEENES